ncbi:uncharacterized protein LOC142334668 isoform X2 [Convolutriloba macropyga]|uniref:uncharacterized protein LOC142334668 isoform X2 n=1 Tax=Convolutriloba macropyga TaxID=536237 RepID=UPI003F5268DE
MARPDSGKVSEAPTEVDVVTVDDVTCLSREQLEVELVKVRTDYQQLYSLVSRVFNSDTDALEELRVKFNPQSEPIRVTGKTVKSGLGSRKDRTSPNRAVTFSSVQTRFVERPDDHLKLRREATFVNFDRTSSRNVETDNALSNRLCKLDSYMNMQRGITEASSSTSSVSDHRMLRMVSISDSNNGTRPNSSVGNGTISRPKSASQTRNAFHSYRNEVYNPNKFTQPVPKHSFDEINSFLNGNKSLPTPGNPNTEFNFTTDGDVYYDDSVSQETRSKRSMAYTNLRYTTKTSLVPPRRDQMQSDEEKDGSSRKTPLTSQKTPLKWNRSEIAAGHAYDSGFLDETTDLNCRSNNSSHVPPKKQQGSLKKGFTTSRSKNESSRAGERVPRPKSAVACYTEFVYSVPTPIVVNATAEGTEAAKVSRTYLRPPRGPSATTRSNSDLTELRQKATIVSEGNRGHDIIDGGSATEEQRSKTAGGIISEAQIEMRMSKHMEGLSHQYKKSTVALQKKIGVAIDGIVK